MSKITNFNDGFKFGKCFHTSQPSRRVLLTLPSIKMLKNRAQNCYIVNNFSIFSVQCAFPPVSFLTVSVPCHTSGDGKEKRQQNKPYLLINCLELQSLSILVTWVSFLHLCCCWASHYCIVSRDLVKKWDPR